MNDELRKIYSHSLINQILKKRISEIVYLLLQIKYEAVSKNPPARLLKKIALRSKGFLNSSFLIPHSSFISIPHPSFISIPHY